MPLPLRLHKSLLVALSLGVYACSGVPELLLNDDDKPSNTGGRNGTGGGDIPIPIGGSGNTDTGGGSGDDEAVCGNGILEIGELCDDGGTKSGDGCSKDCAEQDPDFDCSVPGEPCKDLVICGNGILEGNEVCDEGANTTGACQDECTKIADGYACTRPNVACVALPVCGNGVRERGEECDDAQSPPEDGDGCSANCAQDPAYFCIPGQLCKLIECGNGQRTPLEACDDDNLDAGDGCSPTCTVEPGFRCGATGCRAICGDGLIRGDETCDDDNRSSGDGCSSACLEESYLYDCVGEPSVCTSKAICGNNVVDPTEICDDGPGGDCVDPPATNACRGFIVVGVDPPVCGDGTLQVAEECEDSDTSNDDGCSSTCEVEDGWVCPKLNYCYKLPACGDGILQAGEECDISGSVNEPSCTDCVVQPGFYCSGEPSVCVVSVCGDGQRAPDEACDNGGTAGVPGVPVGGDGCSTTCTVETGWVCPPNVPCQPTCRDGVLNGAEECESSTNGGALPTGCVNCKVSAGYDCGATGKTCVTTSCGNGTPDDPATTGVNEAITAAQRGEGCDDGNTIAGDGCGPTCQLEPGVTRASPDYVPVMQVTCGDGIVTGSEACDDGNKNSGDGCSSACLEESGWTCDESLSYPSTIDFRVTYRDFRYRDSSTNEGHPDFESTISSANAIPGPVCVNGSSDRCTAAAGSTCEANTCGYLDFEGKPILHVTPNSSGGGTMTSVDHYAIWYRSTNSYNAKAKNGTTNVGIAAVTDTLTLTQQGGATSDVYQFEDSTFFPLNKKGFQNSGSTGDNFSFTTELRYYFQYKGGEVLDFRGDDDVWVFVNGHHAVDIGGIHCAQAGRVVLGDEDSSCSLHHADNDGDCALTGTFADCTRDGTETSDATDNRFGLTKGNVYEIVLFQAERHTSQSNFKLTLQGFLAPRSTCQTTCGDGIRAGTELCDAGTYHATNNPNGNQNGKYGQCNTSCSLTFCGDGTKQTPDEACDNGENGDVWTANGAGCAPGCVLPAKCGDAIVQGAFEVCDDGVNDGSYGGCAAGCQALGGYCGDNTKNGTEDCDTGPARVVYGSGPGFCGFDCKPAPYCGDGIRNGTEQCDGGAGCNSVCQIIGSCGDGTVGGTEECDQGTYNSATPPYGGCYDDCTDGPGCGDGTPEAPYEECDDGVDNQDGLYDGCTSECLNGPRCGDGTIQVGLEVCDNGYNQDTYAYSLDACGPTCKALPYCGDGLVQSDFEVCDNGPLNVDGTYDGCNADCKKWGPYCGDGSKNGPEQCDDGADNVSYSADGTGCSYDCTKPPSCGDGTRNGPEQCDLGTADNTGAYGSCNADCTLAPRCGDKKIDKSNGEQCDDGPTGSLACSPLCKSRRVIK